MLPLFQARYTLNDCKVWTTNRITIMKKVLLYLLATTQTMLNAAQPSLPKQPLPSNVYDQFGLISQQKERDFSLDPNGNQSRCTTYLYLLSQILVPNLVKAQKRTAASGQETVALLKELSDKTSVQIAQAQEQIAIQKLIVEQNYKQIIEQRTIAALLKTQIDLQTQSIALGQQQNQSRTPTKPTRRIPHNAPSLHAIPSTLPDHPHPQLLPLQSLFTQQTIATPSSAASTQLLPASK